MVPIELLERYERRLEELIDQRVESIVSGNVDDFPMYQRLTGEVRGLRLAINELQELVAAQTLQ
jgi:hypothetical protein